MTKKNTKIVVRLDSKFKNVDKDKNVLPEVMVFDKLCDGWDEVAASDSKPFVQFLDNNGMPFMIKKEDILFIREVEVKEQQEDSEE
tara:strand:- start:115 stop:372 length:258 start_codon:yes stop_codon:yes gene_type:complete